MALFQIVPINIQRRLTKVFVLPVVLMLTLAGVLSWQISRLLEVTQWVNHTNIVIAQANLLQKLLVDMETGLRGYLVTENPDFLEPYTQGSLLIDPAFNELARLTSDNIQQQQSIRELRQHYTRWKSYSSYMLKLKKGSEDYQTYSINAVGKERMDIMRRRVTLLLQTEEKLRDQRTQAATQTTRLMFFGSTGLLLLVGSGIALFTKHQLNVVSRNYKYALDSVQDQAEALRVNKQQLQAILDGVTAVIYVKDIEGRYVSVNRQFESLFHRSKEVVKGKTDYDLFTQEIADVLRENDRKVIEGGIASIYEEVVLQDGELRTYLSNKSPLKGYGNVTYAVCGISTDISERKQAEKARLKQIEQEQTITQLKELNDLKDDFLNTVSHELRTPIANMKMALVMLKISLPDTNERSSQYLEILQAECNRESELISELLDLQRLETGAYSTSPIETVNLEEVLPNIIKPFQIRSRQRQQTLKIDSSSPLSVIFCARPSLERVLAELLNNACKYTPVKGEIIVRICYESTEAKTIFTISNSAEIPADQLPYIFDKFYRAPGGDPDKQGGTGLGLALVQKLVEQMQGSILVKSSGGWTSFTVELADRTLKEVSGILA